MSSAEPHSAAYFNEQRDFWWNADYLSLLGRRLALDGCAAALDVGSGQGHWGRLLLPMLAAEATVIGLEREPRWVQRAAQLARDLRIGDRCAYVQGTAEALSFEDQSFDLVTCQTVLIHVADVAAVLAEMFRVLRPGGLLLLAEPNNRAGALVADSITRTWPPDRVMERLEFTLICERGKRELGEGDNSVGDLLVEHLARLGLIEIESFLNDKTFALVPPYSSPDQQALRSAIIETAERGDWIWPVDETRRCFIAGGGEELDFHRRWQLRLREVREEADELLAGRLSTGGGGIQYIVSGRRAN